MSSLQDVYDHLIRTIDRLDTYREVLANVVDTFSSVQPNKLNRVVNALTVTSIVLLSGTVVAGVYGMTFAYRPELQRSSGLYA